MPDLTYTSTHTGSQLDDAIERALPLDTFAEGGLKTVGGVTYHILWKNAPTASNTVYGIAVHPSNGKLYIAKSVNNTVSVVEAAVLGDQVNIGNADYDTTAISITGVSGTTSATVASYNSTTKTLELSSAISVPAADETKTFHGALQADNQRYVCKNN